MATPLGCGLMTLSRDDFRVSVVAPDGEEKFREPLPGSQVIDVFNGVGAFTLQFPVDDWLIEASRPGARVRVRDDTQTLFSGPVRPRKHESDGQTVETIELSGPSDMTWLKDRAAHPEPATASPPYNTDAHDTRTGPASTIIREFVDNNVGPSALAARRVSGFTVAGTAGLGTSVTRSARWQSVLELCQSIAAEDGLAFRVVDLEFTVFEPATTDLEFSEDLNSLGAWAHHTTPPAATYLYGLGPGELTTRTVVEAEGTAATSEWGRIEATLDQRNAASSAEQTSGLDAALVHQGEFATGELIDTARYGRYGADYRLGDAVTLHLPSEQTLAGQPVTSVVIDWTTTAITVQPSVGALTSGRVAIPPDAGRLYHAVHNLNTQMSAIRGA